MLVHDTLVLLHWRVSEIGKMEIYACIYSQRELVIFKTLSLVMSLFNTSIGLG